MTAIERTAYPSLKSNFTPSELEEFFSPTEQERNFILSIVSINSSGQELPLMILLKATQKLGFLPALKIIPDQLVEYIASQLDCPVPDQLKLARRTRSRTRKAIYEYLKIQPYAKGGKAVVEDIVKQSAEIMSDPADLINVAIEHLILNHFEIPGFTTLDTLVAHIRSETHKRLYAAVVENLTAAQKDALNSLLIKPQTDHRYPFTRLKQLPSKASLTQAKEWE